jgi:uncharacterized coiled-coil DUF342 family protein
MKQLMQNKSGDTSTVKLLSALLVAAVAGGGGMFGYDKLTSPSIDKDIQIMEQRKGMSRDAEIAFEKINARVDLLAQKSLQWEKESADLRNILSGLVSAIKDADMTGKTLAVEMKSYREMYNETIRQMREDLKQLREDMNRLIDKIDDIRPTRKKYGDALSEKIIP